MKLSLSRRKKDTSTKQSESNSITDTTARQSFSLSDLPEDQKIYGGYLLSNCLPAVGPRNNEHDCLWMPIVVTDKATCNIRIEYPSPRDGSFTLVVFGRITNTAHNIYGPAKVTVTPVHDFIKKHESGHRPTLRFEWYIDGKPVKPFNILCETSSAEAEYYIGLGFRVQGKYVLGGLL